MDRDASGAHFPHRPVVLRVANPAASPIHVRMEPWGREYDLDVGEKREFTLTGPDPIDLEVEVLPAEVVVYGWTGSTLDDIGLPVPSTPSRSNDLPAIALHLTAEEALVLDAFLARGHAAGDDYSSILDQAELRVLWDIAAMLESQMPIVNKADYEQVLASARARVRDSTE